jgi:hypothetical protein
VHLLAPVRHADAHADRRSDVERGRASGSAAIQHQPPDGGADRYASHEIWDAATDSDAPKTDEAWRELQHHAIQLAMAGPAIALGGNGQADAGFVKLVGWRDYAQKLTNAGVAAFRATETKSLPALQMAGDALIETCNGCHKESKPVLPSEGYLHPHYDGVPK